MVLFDFICVLSLEKKHINGRSFIPLRFSLSSDLPKWICFCPQIMTNPINHTPQFICLHTNQLTRTLNIYLTRVWELGLLQFCGSGWNSQLPRESLDFDSFFLFSGKTTYNFVHWFLILSTAWWRLVIWVLKPSVSARTILWCTRK